MAQTILYLICAIAGVLGVWMLATDIAGTLAVLRDWKAGPVLVWETSDGRSYEVKWGKDEEFSTNVPVSPLALYSNLSPEVL